MTESPGSGLGRLACRAVLPAISAKSVADVVALLRDGCLLY